MASSLVMASSSGIKRHQVFTSFHGPDVRKGFLSHLHTHFESKGITTFNDQKIDRGQTIGPELVSAIRESRVLLVLLSKNYASSGWCLDELVEIMKCKNAVMTIFYGVDPSSVRKQKGDFGSAFMKTCQGKTKGKKQRWRKALTDVAEIAGEHSLNWATEAEMIQKIATEVSKKLSITPSKDFDEKVGLKAHLTKLNSLLRLECEDEVKMIGMWGPAGIGKSTIARALYDQLSGSFRFKCFMGNLTGRIKGSIGVGDYDSKLDFQGKFLSSILGRDMRVHHLGGIKEWLHDKRVLIILDDVDREKLDLLAKEPSWFGPGSRIIVATEDISILRAHGIGDIYNVDFPSKKEAIEILCLSAFKGASVQDGFEELAEKVAGFCSSLPLALDVVGSSLHGQDKTEWERQLVKFETSLDVNIEEALRVGYDRLTEKDQALFLHIACFFFFGEDVDHLTAMLAKSTTVNVKDGLKTLTDRSLVHISFYREIVMHSLLQKLGRQIVVKQSPDPGKRMFLIDPEEIRHVLAAETGTKSLIGIRFDMTNTGEFCISKGAFEGMRNLQFLQIYTQLGMEKGNCSSLKIKEDLEFLPRLRLLAWHLYPGKRLPPTFRAELLVELSMQFSMLEMLWDGKQNLANLKKINLNFSKKLKEIPDLSEAINLEALSLSSCSSLVELPYSIKNLHKLRKLKMARCEKLRIIPTNIDLKSLREVDMMYCSQLGTFPDISSNIKILRASHTKIKDVPASVVGRWSHCGRLEIGSKSLERLTHVPLSVTRLDLINSDITRIPDCITGLPHLVDLIIENCTKLVSITALPPSLKSLNANSCITLETVHCSFHNTVKVLTFYNCVKLDEEARRGIIQQSVREYLCLPAKEVPAEFTHKATGKSITIPLAPGDEATFSAPSRFKACFLLSPIKDCRFISLWCRLKSKEGVKINSFYISARLSERSPLSKHLFIIHGDLFDQRNRCHEVDMATGEITFEFSCDNYDDKIIGCGVQILGEEAEGSSRNSEVDYFDTESSSGEVENFEPEMDGEDAGYELMSMILSLDEDVKTKEAEDSSSDSEEEDFENESDSRYASDELVATIRFLIISLFEYIQMTAEAEGSSRNNEVENFENESNSGEARDELVPMVPFLILSLFEYVKTREAERGSRNREVENFENESNSGDEGDEFKAMVRLLFLSMCENIKTKEAEGGSSNREVESLNTESSSREVENFETEKDSEDAGHGLVAMIGFLILSLFENIKKSVAMIWFLFPSLCENIKTKEAEGGISNSEVESRNNSSEVENFETEMDSGDVGHELVAIIRFLIVSVTEYMKAKVAEGGSSNSEVETFNTESSSSEVENFEYKRKRGDDIFDELVAMFLFKVGLKKKIKKTKKPWHKVNLIIDSFEDQKE